MRVRRASTSCVTSLTTLALSLGESVVNHLANRWNIRQEAELHEARGPLDNRRTTLPCLDNRIRYLG